MSGRKVILESILSLAFSVFLAGGADAQQASGIAGIIRDTGVSGY